MSRRARILIAGGGTLLVGVCTLWAAPRLLKPRLIAAVEAAADEQLKGTLSLGAVSLSAIRDFPRLTLTADDVSVTGEGDFDGEILLAAGRIQATLDLWDALEGRYTVEALRVRSGQALLHVSAGGAASWDLFEPTEPADDDSPLAFAITELDLDDIAVSYVDIPGGSTAMVEGLSGSGDLQMDGSTLNVALLGSAPSVTYRSGELAYVEQGSVTLDVRLHSDTDAGRYTLDDNRITLNALPLSLDGTVDFIDEGLDLDLTFAAADAGFKELLSAVPAIYARDFDGIDASGTIGLSGAIKGRSTEALMPGLSVDVSVTDGRFRYPSLPGEVSGITVDASLSSPEAEDLDDMVVDIRKLSGAMGGQPFDARLKVTDTQTDPLVDAQVRMDIDLGRLGEFIPLAPEESYSGRVTTDVRLAGRSSDAQAGRYAAFSASGPVEISGMRYDSPDFPHPIEIDAAEMALVPEGLRIDRLQARTGSSDALVSGQLDDLLGYVFEEKDLSGTLSIRSQRVDMADFSEEPAEGAAAEAGAVVIPDGYALQIGLDADTVVYDDMTFSGVKGGVDVRDQRATLSKVTMAGLGGRIAVDGTYAARTGAVPRMDFTVGLEQLAVEQLAGQLDLTTMVAPLAAQARGALSAEFRLKGDLDEAMMPILTSLQSDGSLAARELTLAGAPIAVAVAQALNVPSFRDVTLSGLRMRYDLEAGRVKVKPTTLRFGGVPAVLSGSQGLDQSLDYTLVLDMPTGGIGAKLTSGLLSDAGLALDVLPETLQVALKLGGTFSKPTVRVSLADAKDALLSSAREQVAEVASDAAAQILAEAQAQADEIMAIARKASRKLLDEADAQAQNLISAAKNPLARVAAEAAAEVLLKEARKQSRKLLNRAETKSDSLIAEAQVRADAL